MMATRWAASALRESGAARILDRADQFLARAGGSPAPAEPEDAQPAA